MSTFDEDGLRTMLALYTVEGTPDELVTKTILHLENELLSRTAAPSRPVHWVFFLTGFAVVLCLCLFYMVTVDTVLRLIISSYLLRVLTYGLYAYSIAGGIILVGTFLLFCLKHPGERWAVNHPLVNSLVR